MKCQLCEAKCKNLILIKNRINGNQLNICEGCAKKFKINEQNRKESGKSFM